MTQIENERLRKLLKDCLDQFELEYGQQAAYLGTNIRNLIFKLREEFKNDR